MTQVSYPLLLWLGVSVSVLAAFVIRRIRNARARQARCIKVRHPETGVVGFLYRENLEYHYRKGLLNPSYEFSNDGEIWVAVSAMFGPPPQPNFPPYQPKDPIRDDHHDHTPRLLESDSGRTSGRSCTDHGAQPHCCEPVVRPPSRPQQPQLPGRSRHDPTTRRSGQSPGHECPGPHRPGQHVRSDRVSTGLQGAGIKPIIGYEAFVAVGSRHQRSA